MEWLDPVSIAIVADARRLVPVPLQLVLAAAAGAFLLAILVALWRAEQAAAAERIDPESGLLAEPAFRVAAGECLDTTDPVAFAVAEPPADGAPDWARLRESVTPLLRGVDAAGRTSSGSAGFVVRAALGTIDRIAERAEQAGFTVRRTVVARGSRATLADLERKAAAGETDADAVEPGRLELLRKAKRRRVRTEAETDVLTRASFLREVEHLMFARRRPASQRVAVIAIAQTTGDGTGPLAAAAAAGARPDDLVGRVDDRVLAIACVADAEGIPGIAEILRDDAARTTPDEVRTVAGYAVHPDGADTSTAVRIVRAAALALPLEGDPSSSVRAYQAGMARTAAVAAAERVREERQKPVGTRGRHADRY